MTCILITGATGFIGRHLIPRLSGFELIATVRGPRASIRGVRFVEVAPLHGRTPWEKSLTDVDVVVHLAGIAHRGQGYQHREAALYDAVNTQATIALADAAAKAGVHHFVFLSTIFVHGPTTDGRPPFSERDAFDAKGAYARSKAAAERGLDEISARTGLICTTIRAPLIYGDGARGNLRVLARAIRMGVPLPLASVKNLRSFLGVENLTDFIVHRLAQRPEASAAFIVADNEQVSTSVFVSLVGAALGCKPRLFAFPPPALAIAMAAIGRGSMADALLSSLVVDTSSARATGWVPAVRLAEGLRRSFGDRGDALAS